MMMILIFVYTTLSYQYCFYRTEKSLFIMTTSLSNYFVNNHFVSHSIFLCLDFSVKLSPPLSDHFFLHSYTVLYMY